MSDWQRVHNSVYEQEGYAARVYGFMQLLRQEIKQWDELRRIREGYYQAVLVHMPSKALLAKQHPAAQYQRWNVIKLWFEEAKKAGIPAAILGADSSAWEAAPLRIMHEQGTVYSAVHRWCALGVLSKRCGTTDVPLPASRRHRTLSTFLMPSHICPHRDRYHRHGDRVELDRETPPHGGSQYKRGRERLRDEKAIVAALLATLSRHSTYSWCRLAPSRVPESNILTTEKPRR